MSNDLSLLMEENLAQVWSQRDAFARLQSIRSIYTVDSALYHVGHKTTGHEAINESVNNVLDNMPSEFSFFKLKPVVINNNMGRLIWGLGPNKESIVATGMDIAVFEDGKIESLYVFLD
ncbi:putative oxidoreductase (fatty acid repression mutant protein) [Algoriphagus sp. 4150]|uniref:nuclear transport factor 2 family protein n=1 Tax=Algoriphagus sp. 4150 TaxID=2817756 RepID=UPI00285A32EC|nr:nuclear transport factor 2 family protein [Algoriphagus sp. 4150]MDR7127937.1 putative oxidoreductase (fatty acid repression mutant protein) [Algoriphagus sp. 4150]